MLETGLIAPIPELLRRQAEAQSDRVAFRDASDTITYGALFEATGNLAGHLTDLGLKARESAAIFLPNSIPWVVCCLAVARAGGVGVPISYASSDAEISYRLVDADCRIIVTTDEQAERLSRLCAAIPSIGRMILVGSGREASAGISYSDLVEQAGPRPAPDPSGLDAAAFIVYTSGTTGQAKGVLLSVRSMLWVTAACWAPITGLSARDTVLSPLPLFHSYALNLSVLSILATGASAYIMERFSTSEVLRLLASGDFTFLPGVPTMFHYLLQAARDGGQERLPGLERCASAGAIMPATLNREFEEHFQVPLLDGYGITETATMVTMNWPRGTRIMGSCGLPLPGLATRIIDPANGLDVTAGGEGELIVRGPNLMLGYHQKPAETAAAIRNGWYYTGDLARSDADGYLTITGRLKELIIRGGQNIAPTEVEEVANTYDGILDCAVVGVAHAELGEAPVIFVVPAPGKSLETNGLLAHCRAELSSYKVPTAVHLIDEIPRTGSGKIIRFKLLETLQTD